MTRIPLLLKEMACIFLTVIDWLMSVKLSNDRQIQNKSVFGIATVSRLMTVWNSVLWSDLRAYGHPVRGLAPHVKCCL